MCRWDAVKLVGRRSVVDRARARVAGCSKDAAPTQGAVRRARPTGSARPRHDELGGQDVDGRTVDGGARRRRRTERFVRADGHPRPQAMTGELRGIAAAGRTTAPYLDRPLQRRYDHALDLWYSDPLGRHVGSGPATAAEARIDSYGMEVCAEAGDIEVDDEVSG